MPAEAPTYSEWVEDPMTVFLADAVESPAETEPQTAKSILVLVAGFLVLAVVLTIVVVVVGGVIKALSASPTVWQSILILIETLFGPTGN